MRIRATYSILPYNGTITSDSLIHLKLQIRARVVAHFITIYYKVYLVYLYTDRYYISIILAKELERVVTMLSNYDASAIKTITRITRGEVRKEIKKTSSSLQLR